jgi:hypothetical protein
MVPTGQLTPYPNHQNGKGMGDPNLSNHPSYMTEKGKWVVSQRRHNTADVGRNDG